MRPEDFDDLVLDIEYFNHRFSTPNWIIEDATINFVDLTYVVDGKADYVIDNVSYPVRPGDLICVPRGSRRSATTYEDALIESYCINATLTNLRGEEMTLPFPLIHRIGHQPEILSLLSELKSAWLLRDGGYRLRARALGLMIVHWYIQLVVFKHEVRSTDMRIQRIIRHVVDHYNEPITLQDMAEMAGLSPMYFGSLFKQEVGMSFKRYLTSIRMNYAEDMLSSGEFSVNEVAIACGFSDVFYFSKVFKEYHGVSPSKITRFGNKCRYFRTEGP